MKLFVLALILILAPMAGAADWVDQGDGTWTCSVTFTAPTTTVKDQLEQARKFSNYRTRLLSDQLDASQWLNDLMFGVADTQHPNPDASYNSYIKLYRTLWQEFTNTFVAPAAPDPLAAGLAVEVPAPPADPVPPSP